MSGKLKTVREIKEKSENFAKSLEKLKFFVLKSFNVCNISSFEILST